MEICAATAIFFASLVFFKVCLAQDLEAANSSVYEATIWISGLAPSTAPDHFSMTPNRSAAIISPNLILTVQQLPTTNSSGDYAAVFLKTNFFTSTNFTSFHRMTKVTIPSVDTDAEKPKLEIYKVDPPLRSNLYRTISIRDVKTKPDEMCTMSVWRKNTLYTGQRKTVTDACPNASPKTFCVNLLIGDSELTPFGGGLVECDKKLAGMYYQLISPNETLQRSYLDLSPYRERIEQIIVDNGPPIPGNSSSTTASTGMGLLAVTLVASRSVW